MPETPLQPSFDDFLALCQEGNLVSVWTELTADYETPLSAFQKISDGQYSFLFESAETREDAGRYSFLGTSPRLVFACRDGQVTLSGPGRESESYPAQWDPLAELESIMRRCRPAPANGLPVFHGGAVGYLAYDAVHYFEPTVPLHPRDDLNIPDLLFMITDTVMIFDHRFRRLQIVANVFLDDYADPRSAYDSAREKIEEVIRRLRTPLHYDPVPTLTPIPEPVPVSNTTREAYCGMVERAKEYIRAGDIFQVVPSQRFEVPYAGSPLSLYRALRHINPSPYMFCLQFPDGFSLVGSSPEVHVRAIDGRVEIRPIAGTRWRGASEGEDQALEEELLADPKERAEHIMLVDLARNDVGRIAEFDSVRVTDLMIIERYSHVMHIVSNVEGRLDPSRSAYDVMRATFPAGTVSGSPKVRAMQIIREMEISRRGAYAGAVGYFGFDGNLDSCIALRTAVLQGGTAYVQAGAGVVADSVPESEYTETVNKARGLLRAVEWARLLR
ncbi:MAG TPA: anthranilate synthase component I [Verrucomicrobiales bacterium]|nr:anthranilate synthase component I [Verrucomicrobiales bacterium]